MGYATKIKSFIKNELAVLFLCIVFSSLSIYYILFLFNLEIGIRTTILVTAILNLLYSMIFHSKKATIVFVCLIPLILALLGYKIYTFFPKELSSVYYLEFIFEGLLLEQEKQFIKATLLAILTLPFYLLICKLKKYYITSSLGLGLIILLAELSAEVKQNHVYLIGVLSIIWLISGCYISYQKNNRLFFKKNKIIDNKIAGHSNFLLFILPISLVIILTVQMTPKTIPPKYLRLFNHYYSELYYSLTTFNTSNSIVDGAFDSRSIDGKANPSNLHVLSVIADIQPLYLKGSVKDEYIKSSWKDTINTETNLMSINNEVNEQIREIELGRGYLHRGDYYRRRKPWFYLNRVFVNFENIRSNRLFTTSIFQGLTITDNDVNLSVGDGGEVLLVSKKTKNFSYKFFLMEPSFTDHFLEYSFIGLYDSFYNKGDKSQRLKFLRARARNAYENYTQLPELPERVYDLANQLAKENNLESLNSIYNYLYNNYKYTLTPPKRPSKHDAVDYFLFESKQGYCSSFASAMVILSRCLGIPARYCEGYVVYEDEELIGYDFKITNKNAHAWAEIYLEGYGWITVDPTGPDRNNNEPEHQSVYNPLPVSTTAPPTHPPTNKPTAKPSVEATTDAANPSDPTKSSPEPENSARKSQEGSIRRNIINILLIALVILLIATYYWRKRTFKKRLLSADPRQGLFKAFPHYMKTLRLMGYKIKPDETLKEYNIRLNKENYQLFNTGEFYNLIENYSKARYSNHPIQTEDLISALTFGDKLDEYYLRTQTNFLLKTKYFIYKYLLCLV